MRILLKSNLKKIVIVFLLFQSLIFAQKSLGINGTSLDAPSSETKEESLFLRRMIDFWEEGRKDIVKMEIEKYLEENENDAFFDYLYALLGDIYLSEDKISKASGNYEKIQGRHMQQKVALNFLQSLYLQKNYEKFVEKAGSYEAFFEGEEKKSYNRFTYMLADSLLNYSSNQQMPKEKANLLIAKAKEKFKLLLDTSYESYVLENLAFLEGQLGEYQKAADRFFALAKIYNDREETYLYEAGVMQANFDREAALETFKKVTHIGREKKSDAAYNRLVLLFQMSRFAEIISLKDHFAETINKSKKVKYNYYLAKSFIAKGDLENAKISLKKILNKNEKSDFYKESLLILGSLTQKMQDDELLSKVIKNYEKTFEKDVNIAKLYFALGLIYQNKKMYTNAELIYDYIEENFLYFDDVDFYVESAYLYYNNENYLKSRLHFKECISKAKNNKEKATFWRYFISSSIKMGEIASKEKSLFAKSIVIRDLEDFLLQEEIVTNVEKKKYLQMLAQLKYEIEDYEAAISDLTALKKNYSDMENDPKVNLLMAYAYLKIEEKKIFCEIAEQALEKDKSSRVLDHKNVHLAIYNTYLELGDDPSYNAIAASHLYSAYLIDNDAVKQENILWLVDYYYNKAKTHFNTYSGRETAIAANKVEIDRSINLLERLISENSKDYKLTKENAFLENEIFKLSDLYGYINENEKKKILLENFASKNKPKQKSLFHERAYFCLGQTLQALSDIEGAKRYFSMVEAKDLDSYYHLASQLFLTRLTYLNYPRFLKNNNGLSMKDPSVIKALVFLKNLKLKKNLANEPMHIEAAIDYVDLNFLIERDLAKKIDLLEKIKADFTTNDGVISKDYNAAKNILPEKEKILNAYLMYVEASIYFTKALVNDRPKDINRAYKLMRVVNKYYVVSPYLHKKVQEALNILEIKKKQVAAID